MPELVLLNVPRRPGRIRRPRTRRPGIVGRDSRTVEEVVSMFDSVTVRVVVRDGDLVGTGAIVHEESAVLPLADEPISLNLLFDVSPAFFYERLEMYDGYGVQVEGRAVRVATACPRRSSWSSWKVSPPSLTPVWARCLSNSSWRRSSRLRMTTRQATEGGRPGVCRHPTTRLPDANSGHPSASLPGVVRCAPSSAGPPRPGP